jgi:threonine/homoserine/homoserine lactone efflux protein
MSFIVLWLAVMFPLVFSPGPANIVFAASGASVGVKKSLPLMLGIDFVFILKSVLIGYGFGNVIEQYPLILQILQFAGSFYIGYLAVVFLKSGLLNHDQSYKRLSFKDGMVIQLLNAKGWIMIVLMFSLFTESAQIAFGDLSILVLIALLAVLNVSVHILWIWGGEIITRMTSNKKNHKIQSIIYFLCLTIVAVWLFLDNPYWSL